MLRVYSKLGRQQGITEGLGEKESKWVWDWCAHQTLPSSPSGHRSQFHFWAFPAVTRAIDWDLLMECEKWCVRSVNHFLAPKTSCIIPSALSSLVSWQDAEDSVKDFNASRGAARWKESGSLNMDGWIWKELLSRPGLWDALWLSLPPRTNKPGEGDGSSLRTLPTT